MCYLRFQSHIRAEALPTRDGVSCRTRWANSDRTDKSTFRLMRPANMYSAELDNLISGRRPQHSATGGRLQSVWGCHSGEGLREDRTLVRAVTGRSRYRASVIADRATRLLPGLRAAPGRLSTRPAPRSRRSSSSCGQPRIAERLWFRVFESSGPPSAARRAAAPATGSAPPAWDEVIAGRRESVGVVQDNEKVIPCRIAGPCRRGVRGYRLNLNMVRKGFGDVGLGTRSYCFATVLVQDD